MSGHLSVLQANVNNCAGAQDLLLQSMAEWSIDVAIVAEPYAVPPSPHWVGDTEDLVAIKVRPGAGPPSSSRRGAAGTWRRFGERWLSSESTSPRTVTWRPWNGFSTFWGRWWGS
ncbi:unnamed protein product [Euphydryas editha]|uniref:Uncharacterized protein n=1 Tax=Euphydryas editha TaxID=104508 RepID=A0AAU9V336_EUPED|nr:unnamed protein product [Euphydryas editha]